MTRAHTHDIRDDKEPVQVTSSPEPYKQDLNAYRTTYVSYNAGLTIEVIATYSGPEIRRASDILQIFYICDGHLYSDWADR